MMNTTVLLRVLAMALLVHSSPPKPLRAPKNFTLVHIFSGTEALLRWKPVSRKSVPGHFKGYRIQTWTDSEDRIFEFETKPNVTMTMIDNLKPNKKNFIRVMVYNQFGNGPPSKTLSLVTPEGKPGPVGFLNAFPVDSSSILLIWGKPTDENGILTGYKVYYGKNIGSWVEPLVEWRKLIDPKFNHAKLAGLQPDTRYRIEIRALTKAGAGKGFFVEETTLPWMPPLHSTMWDAVQLEARTMTANKYAAHVFVHWLPLFKGTHFKVSYRLKGHPQWMLWQMETDDDYIIITGLEPNQVYEVKVTAYRGDCKTESEVKEVDTAVGGYSY